MRMVPAVLFMTMIFSSAWAQTSAPLADVEKPKAVVVAADRFYVVEENCVIRVYSLKDKTLLKTFGKQGQGPREFTETPFIKPLDKELLISSPGKISFYSFDGVLREERKVSVSDVMKNILEPAGDKYVAMKWGQSPDRKGISLEQWVYLYDRDFTNKKLLYSTLLGREGQKIPFLFPLIGFHVDKNNIFVAEGYKGFVIEVFDLQGTPVGIIRRASEKMKIDKVFKQEREKELQKGGGELSYFEWPDYYPDIKSFFVDNGRVWVKTYKRNGDNIEFFLFDSKGQELKQIFLPDGDNLYAFYGDTYSCLKFNLAKDTWEWLTTSLTENRSKKD